MPTPHSSPHFSPSIKRPKLLPTTSSPRAHRVQSALPPISPAKSADEELDDLFDGIVATSDNALLDGVAVLAAYPTPNVEFGNLSTTEKAVDDLFDDIVSTSDSRLLDGMSAEQTHLSAVLTPANIAGCASTPANNTAGLTENLFDEIITTAGCTLLEGLSRGECTPPSTRSAEQKVEDLLDSISEDIVKEVAAAESSLIVSLHVDGTDDVPVPCAVTSNGKEELNDTISYSQGQLLDDEGSSAQASISTALPMNEASMDPTQQERKELLSNIESLRSELADKNKLISLQDQEKNGGVALSMKEEFTCVICQELFVSAHTLPCSHSFCELCIKAWLQTKKECPICRKHVASGPVCTLALNNVITAMEDKLTTEERKERDALKQGHKEKLEKMVNNPAADDSPSSSSSHFDGYSDLDSDFDSVTSSVASDEEFFDFDEDYGYFEYYSFFDYDNVVDAFYEGGGRRVRGRSGGYPGFSGYGGFDRCFNCGKLAIP